MILAQKGWIIRLMMLLIFSHVHSHFFIILVHSAPDVHQVFGRVWYDRIDAIIDWHSATSEKRHYKGESDEAARRSDRLVVGWRCFEEAC